MPLTIWNCVMSYKQKILFSENQLVVPKITSITELFDTHIFNRWHMGFLGGKCATRYC